MAEAVRRRRRRLPSILRTILASKRVRLEQAKARHPLAELRAACRDLAPARDLAAALRRPADGAACAVIAEFKPRSPSRGLIRAGFDLLSLERLYRAGGADAYSVLTEEDHFAGCLANLSRLRPVAVVPLLRKDFLFDPYQIYESRAAGSDALLLIAAVLENGPLQELLGLSAELGLQALVEVHDREELERSLSLGSRLVGINNRNLHTFEVNPALSLELSRYLPEGTVAVSESGIRGPEDIRRLAAAGIRAFLVGEHLLSAADPAAALRRLKEAL